MSEIIDYGSMSFQQKQSYDYHMSLTDTSSYEIMLLNLDVSDLRRDFVILTINRLYYENDSFRTIFTKAGGETYQQVLKLKSEEDYYYDIIDSSEEVYDDAKIESLLSTIGSTMGLSGGSLLAKCAIVGFKHGVVRCVFFIHHIIADLWSMLIVKKKFYQIYNALVANDGNPDALVKVNYNTIDYAREQKTAYDLNGASGIAYWQKKLAPVFIDSNASFVNLISKGDGGLSSGELIRTVKDRLDTGECGFIVYKIEGKLLASIYQILKESNTGFMALFNLIFSLLPWYNGIHKRVLIASPVNNRLNSRLKSIVGLCGGSIYTYLDPDPILTISALLKQAYIDILKSFKYAITEHNIFKLDGRHLREKSDLFLNITSREFENTIPEHYHTGDAFEGKRIYYALQCSVHEQEDHICLILGYNKEFYSQMQVNTILKSVVKLISIFESNLDKPLIESYDPINSI
jgi:hypothetical protein